MIFKMVYLYNKFIARLFLKKQIVFIFLDCTGLACMKYDLLTFVQKCLQHLKL